MRIAVRVATGVLASLLVLGPPVAAASPHAVPPRTAVTQVSSHAPPVSARSRPAVVRRSPSPTPAPSPLQVRARVLARLFAVLRSAIGIPYLWGGISRLGFDCSGLVQWAFAHVGIALPRTTWEQYAVARPVRAPQPGDLVFFTTYAPGPSHVGIYIGAQKFIQAGDSGVEVSSLVSPYWFAHYIGARTVLPE